MQAWFESISTALDHPWLRRPVMLLFWTILVYFLVITTYYHHLILSDPNQLEYREGAALLPVHLLLAGKNPYALEYMPEATNVYGIVYPLMVYPLAQWLGPSLYTHRLVTALFIGASCLLLALVLRRERVALPYLVAGTLLFYQALMFFVGPLARPDSTGMFFFLASILLPVLGRYSTAALAGSLLLGILGFYTKLYFVLGLLFVSLHLFFYVSRLKGMIYASVGMLILLASMWFINDLFPTYWVNVLLVQMRATAQSLRLSGDDGFTHMAMQFKLFFMLYYPLLILFLLGWAHHYKNKINNNNNNNNNLLAISMILSTLLIYWKLGRNDGNGLVYLLHLILPFLLLSTILRCNKIGKPILALGILVSVSHAHATYFPEPPQTARCRAAWQVARQLLVHEQPALRSPLLTSLALERGQTIQDSGQTIYFFHANPMPDDPLLNRLLPGHATETRLATWSRNLFNAVRQQEFAAIIMPTEIFKSTEIAPYYELHGTLTLCMPPFQDWQLHIYRPKP